VGVSHPRTRFGRLERLGRGESHPSARLQAAESAAKAPIKLDERARRIARLERQAAESDSLINAATDARFLGKMNEERYQSYVEHHEARLMATRAELKELRAQVPTVPGRPPWAEIVRRAGGLLALLRGGTVAEQRDVLRELVARVEARRVGHARFAVSIAWTAFGQWLFDATQSELAA
jgi:hypothetical protein